MKYSTQPIDIFIINSKRLNGVSLSINHKIHLNQYSGSYHLNKILNTGGST